MGRMDDTDVHFTKGHGTQNDFVLLPDPQGRRPLTASVAAALADRHSGIGGDGVIRIVPTALSGVEEVLDQADAAPWFMDYRNADGSVAEMCGNGVRVMAAYLLRNGLVSEDCLAIATRSGVRQVTARGPDFSVDMGPWRLSDPHGAAEQGFDALVHLGGHDPFSALRLDLGNPHTVLALPESVPLESLDLTRPPVVKPEPPGGSNVELVRPIGPWHLAMRVHERGVGETRSCGTGICAAALAMSFWATDAVEPDQQWTVDVPGGRAMVRTLPGDRVELTGPAVLVASGTVDLTALPGLAAQ